MKLLFFVLLISPNAFTSTITQYEVIHRHCVTSQQDEIVALRSFQKDKVASFFAVDPNSLETFILPQAQAFCGSQAPKQSRYESLLNDIPMTTKVLQNEGLEHDDKTSQVYLTFDLCPSEKPLDTELVSFLKTVRKDGLGNAIPVGISLSGGWMSNHQKDLAELEQIERDGDIQITWINHTRHHPYVKGLANEHNFMLEAGVNPLREILDQEILMMSENIKPSIFMRFPGLIADDEQMKLLQSIGIISVGARSWIAKTRTFSLGDIVLIHGNGNEPVGIRLFFNFIHGKWLDYDWSALENWGL